MSADNGIYILETPKPGNTYEYRIIEACGFDINYKPDLGKFNSKSMYGYFKNAAICGDKALALALACDLAKDCYILEYGINIIKAPLPFDTYKDMALTKG